MPITQTEATPGEAEGQAPGGWQGEGLVGFPNGVSTVVNVSTLTRRIFVDGTDSAGNPFPDGQATVYLGETPNVIAQITASVGSLTIVAVPTVQIFDFDGNNPVGFESPVNVNAADVGSQATVGALAQIDTSGFVPTSPSMYYRLYMEIQTANDNGQIETHTLCLLLTVRALATVAAGSDPGTLNLFRPGG